MRGALWFLWRFYVLLTLGSTGAVALAGLAGSQWLRLEFLGAYYDMLPMMVIIFFVLYAFNLVAVYRSVALSMNCRRRDFFWASQLAFAVNAPLATLITWLAGMAPRLLGMEYVSLMERGEGLTGLPVYVQPRMCLFLLAVLLLIQPVSAAMGALYGRSKVLATVLLVVVMLLAIAATTLLLFVSDGTIPFTTTVMWAAVGVLALVCAGCQVYFYRANAVACVR